MKVPIVAIVGRPNVGKSTLFNKIIGARVAVTSEIAGTTRDRLFHKVGHPVIDFFLVDTGGLEFGKGKTSIEDDMQTQTRVAIEEGDVILFVVDGKTGLQPQDSKAAELLRRTVKKPVFLIVSKCDRAMEEVELAEYYSLGLGEPHPLSAFHNLGVEELLNSIVAKLKERHFITKSDEVYKRIQRWEKTCPQIALVGKPNVGKSSLINAILNKEKLIVSDIPGTTRDSTDSLVTRNEKEYNFVDTAGLKRNGRTEQGIEQFSALRSMASIEHCDVTLLVLDSSKPISHQDQVIASYILDAGKGLIILVNKWDVLQSDEDILGEVTEKEEQRRNRYISRLRARFPFLSWAPVIFTSAVSKKNLHVIFEQIDQVMERRRKRISTSQLNSFMQQMIQDHKPTGKGRVNPKIYYITQPEVEPPRFIVFVNRKSAFHFSYIRYIENRLREKFDFMGTPIKIEYREKEREA